MVRYIPIIDAASGKFDSAFDSDTPPSPLSLHNAASLGDYVRSFATRIYDVEWSELKNGGGPPHRITPPDPQDFEYVTQSLPERIASWEIRLWAKRSDRPDDEEDLIIGYTIRPVLNVHQLHTLVYLMLSEQLRDSDWRIVGKNSDICLDWRDQSPLALDSDWKLVDSSGHAVIASLQDPALTFDRKNRWQSATPGSSSSESSRFQSETACTWSTSDSLSRDLNKAALRARDNQRCLISSAPLEGDKLYLGPPSAAHIVPHSRPDISDSLRVLCNPILFRSEEQARRRRVSSHWSNLMSLSSAIEYAYDTFQLYLLPIPLSQPRAGVIFGAGETPSDRHVAYWVGTGSEAPPMSPEADGSTAPSPVFLLVHVLSILRARCSIRIKVNNTDPQIRMEPEDGLEPEWDMEPETPRHLIARHFEAITFWAEAIPVGEAYDLSDPSVLVPENTSDEGAYPDGTTPDSDPWLPSVSSSDESDS